jgi:hypothetical protein
VVSAAVYEPICVNPAARTTLLGTMPTLDDVDIASVQRGDQSHGLVIPRAGGLVGATGGRGCGGGLAGGRGGVSVGGSPTGSYSGIPVGGQGGIPALALGKGK